MHCPGCVDGAFHAKHSRLDWKRCVTGGAVVATTPVVSLGCTAGRYHHLGSAADEPQPGFHPGGPRLRAARGRAELTW